MYRFPTRFLFGVLLSFSFLLTVSAEYRYALLIKQNASTDFQPTIAGLEKFGFQCNVVESKDEKAYRSQLPRFIGRTASNSTVVVIYQGKLSLTSSRSKENRGKPTYGLNYIGSSSSSYPLIDFLQIFKTYGGSKANFFFLDAPSFPEEPEYEIGSHFGVIHGKVADLNAKLASESNFLVALGTAGEIRKKKFPKDFHMNDAPSKAISPPEKFVFGKKAGDEWVNRNGMVFRWCPPGEFTNHLGQEKELTEGFWMMKYEWALGQRIGKRNPSKPIGNHKLHPMTGISHRDIAGTLRSFNQQEIKAGRLPEGYEYNLPTEDQWEYAARAGATSPAYCFGDDLNQLPLYGNFADKAYYDTKDIYSNYGHRTLDDGTVKLAWVGSYRPNAWGIHDMHGNISEICSNFKCRGGAYISTYENVRFDFVDGVWGHKTGFYQGFRFSIQKARPKPQKKVAKKK